MTYQTTTCVAALTLAFAVTVGAAGQSSAAPVLSMTTAVKDAAPAAASEVYYRRGRAYGRHYNNNGGAVALGVLGAVAGAAIYSQNRGPYYQQGYYGGGPSYGYGGPSYGHGYGGGQGYYGNPYNSGPRNFY